jgi:hypothetical protein
VRHFPQAEHDQAWKENPVLVVLGEEISQAQSAGVILDKYRTASIPLIGVRYVHTVFLDEVEKPDCGCKQRYFCKTGIELSAFLTEFLPARIILQR